MSRWWHRAFLEERPSISLSLFRVAVAWTVGAHVIPSFFQMEDNYLSTAFKTKNVWFFPASLLRLVEASPDGVVWTFVLLFHGALATFTLGLWTRRSCLLVTFACYYFYALNPYHIGTLSFDILLVTLFLMCLTPYPGDFLSLDSVRRGDRQAWKRLRPVFLQRLLQLQLAWTFWYTALSKVTGGGNWLTGNPYYSLMRYPSIGVVRDFPLREWLGQHPGLCYGLGLVLLVFEFTVPFLWFIPKTRVVGVSLGITFQFMLWITLHVPTIFVFLFPPMMLLFIRPERLVGWMEARREACAVQGHGIVLYDGRCGFCLASVRRLEVLDLFGWVALRDFHAEPYLRRLHPELTPERCHSEMVVIEPDGRLSGGFTAFRRLCLRLPLLWWLAPPVYLPGAGWIGTRVYRWVARRRSLLHQHPVCETNQCAISGSVSSSAGDSAGSSKT